MYQLLLLCLIFGYNNKWLSNIRKVPNEKRHSSYSWQNLQKFLWEQRNFLTISAIFLLDQKIDSNEFLNRAGIIGNEFNLISNAHKLKLTDWLDHIMNDPTRQTAIDLIKNP